VQFPDFCRIFECIEISAYNRIPIGVAMGSEAPVIPTDKNHLEVAPQWVCEVLSPGTARIDRVRKMPIYARENVDHIWLIDPVKKKNARSVFKARRGLVSFRHLRWK
jgi:hypothetical protein